MNAIIDFLTSFVEIFVSLIEFFVTMVKSIVWLIGNLPQLISGVTAGFAYAPDFLMPFLVSSVSILVVIMLIRLL